MPRLAANLSLLFPELPFLDRFAAAAEAGFRGVEIQFPYDAPADAIAERLQRHGLELVLFNLPPGDWAAGERGLAALPGREADFAAALARALDYARVLACPRLHVMSGMWPAGQPREAGRRTLVENLKRAAERVADRGIVLLIEPLNRTDMPGYFLSDIDDALEILGRVDAPQAALQLDLYHAAMSGENDLAGVVARVWPRFQHVQIAGAPGRHEPDSGSADILSGLPQLDRLGYDGWVGCEYRPAGDTRAGLGWARRWGVGG